MRVPQWVVEEGQAPLRPIVAVWVSMNSGRMNVGALRKPSERSTSRAAPARNRSAMSSSRAWSEIGTRFAPTNAEKSVTL